MKNTYINRNKKIRNLHPTSVRSFLKKNGYNIGTWGMNGRISGMGSFYGGNIEVKEKFISLKSDTDVKDSYSNNGTKIFCTTLTETVAVEVRVWNDTNYSSVSIKDLSKILKSNGWKVNDIRSDSLTVDVK